MDLTTKYLGLTLRTPLVPSASPLSKDVDGIKALEDAGASAVVLHSLFLEELQLEEFELHHHLTAGTEIYREALTYFPEPKQLLVGPDEYLAHLAQAKKAVGIPVIASLNGTSAFSWAETAKEIQQAGADALELNLYSVPTNMAKTAEDIEKECLETVKAVKAAVTIPVAVKLSPYYTSFANFAKRLDEAGADALVLFNRFYQPDIELETLEVEPNLLLSTPQSARLPLRWIAILHSRIRADLAATSGVHTAADAIKMLLVGANVTMLCSALLLYGVKCIKTIEEGIREWAEEREYSSIAELRGSMSQAKCANPAAFERAQYIRAMKSYRPSDMPRLSV